MADEKKPGATGQFPEGKLVADDEGEVMIAVFEHEGNVIISFGDKPIKWLGLNPEEAKRMALMIMLKAQEIEGGSSENLH